jgi:hypothetical protein
MEDLAAISKADLIAVPAKDLAVRLRQSPIRRRRKAREDSAGRPFYPLHIVNEAEPDQSRVQRHDTLRVSCFQTLGRPVLGFSRRGDLQIPDAILRFQVRPM